MLAATALALAMLTPPPIMAQRPAPAQIMDLSEIRLHDGVNAVAALTDDGRDGLIVKGFRSYLTADGSHNDFLVLTRRRAERGAHGDPPWYVVTAGAGATSGPGHAELLSDTPHTGEDQMKSVRFVRARLGGSPAVLLITATRAYENTMPSASHATITIYRLQHDGDADGDVFVQLQTLHPSGCYANTDLVLHVLLNLPLPDDYEGPKASGLCGAAP